MPERTFFTLRYALPGYTFILISILVAYPKVRDVFVQNQNVELVAAFLAFFSLLSGGAIGFLISQVWYTIYNIAICRKYCLRETREFLKEKYHLTEDPTHQIIFLDYLFHALSEKRMQTYTSRRFDLKHTCGSTLSATFIGSIFGSLVRIDFFRTDIYLEKAINSLSNINLGKPKLSTYDLGVILIVAIFSFLLFMGYRHVSKEHSMTVYALVRKLVFSGIFPVEKAEEIFPEDYFSNKDRKETEATCSRKQAK